MIRSIDNTKPGNSQSLTPKQRKILAHFDAMEDSSQDDLLCMAAAIAADSPRRRPKLRLISGGRS